MPPRCRGSSAGTPSSRRCLRGCTRRAYRRGALVATSSQTSGCGTTTRCRVRRTAAMTREANSSEMPNDRTIRHRAVVDAPHRVAVGGKHVARHIDRRRQHRVDIGRSQNRRRGDGERHQPACRSCSSASIRFRSEMFLAIFEAPTTCRSRRESARRSSRRRPASRPCAGARCRNARRARRGGCARGPCPLRRGGRVGSHRDGPAHGLGRRIAEQPLGASIPRGDDAVEILADDGVFRRLDDRRQSECGIWKRRVIDVVILAAAPHSRPSTPNHTRPTTGPVASPAPDPLAAAAASAATRVIRGPVRFLQEGRNLGGNQ